MTGQAWQDLVVVGVAVAPIIVVAIALLAVIARRVFGQGGYAFVLRWARLIAVLLAMGFWGVGAYAEMNPDSVPIITSVLNVLLTFANLLLPLLPPVIAMMGATGVYHFLKKPSHGIGK